MAPVVPRVATTRFGMVSRAVQLRSDASGRVAVEGETVKKLGAVVLVTVTLMTTAVAVPGTGETPPTWRVYVPPGPSVAWPRVSAIRWATWGVKSFPVAVASVK